LASGPSPCKCRLSRLPRWLTSDAPKPPSPARCVCERENEKERERNCRRDDAKRARPGHGGRGLRRGVGGDRLRRAAGDPKDAHHTTHTRTHGTSHHTWEEIVLDVLPVTWRTPHARTTLHTTLHVGGDTQHAWEAIVFDVLPVSRGTQHARITLAHHTRHNTSHHTPHTALHTTRGRRSSSTCCRRPVGRAPSVPRQHAGGR
jgi:hypothetical protein